MSNSLLTMDNGYYCYDQQLPMAPEVPVAPELYSNYEQYAAQRSKTPTSLVNHTGLSPGGPLSTPPMSRTLREDQTRLQASTRSRCCMAIARPTPLPQ